MKLLVSMQFILLMSANILNVEAKTNEFYDTTSNALTVPIVNFHRIDNDLYKYTDLTKITMKTSQFEELLKTLQANNYTTISQEQFIRFYEGHGRISSKSILLTIDDGFKDVYKNAYPLLKKYNMKAVIFPITSDVDKGTRFNAPMMTYEEMEEMVASGHIEVGNHTDNLHWRGNGYKAGYEAMIFDYDVNGNKIVNRYEYIKNDAEKAENKLENIGVNVNAISYPFGAYDNVALKVFKDLHYDVGYTTKDGLNLFGAGYANPLEAKRIDANYKTTSQYIVNKLNNYQAEAKKWRTENKDIQVRSSNYNKNKGITIKVNSLQDIQKNKSTVKEYTFEVYKNINGERTYLGNASTYTASPSKTNNTIQIREDFNNALYKENGAMNYSMKVSMVRKDGSIEVEWINYNVFK